VNGYEESQTPNIRLVKGFHGFRKFAQFHPLGIAIGKQGNENQFSILRQNSDIPVAADFQTTH
jgi:hypothetical protein